MGKNPAFQFYPNDWARDLEEHTLEIEGAWIRICCKLWWSDTRGKLTKTVLQWGRILRVSVEDTIRILNYIKNENIGKISCDFRECNDFVTVISRRMERDEKDREMNRLRVKRFREKQECNAPVTEMKHPSSSSSSSSVITPLSPKGELNNNKNTNSYSPLFLNFWSKYPNKTGKGAAWKSWKKIKSPSTMMDIIITAIKEQSKSEKWRKDNGQYIPNPATWLNQCRWEDETNTEPEITYESVEK